MSQLQSEPLHVGDWVTFPYGLDTRLGQVVEDRGAIGAHGRHLYGVHLISRYDANSYFEAPADGLSRVDAKLQYLMSGALIEMLRTNQGDGKNPPRIRLTADSKGNFSHRLQPFCAATEGAVAPFFALQGEGEQTRIFAPKIAEVIEFLEQLGLARNQAKLVVSAIGTIPN